VEHLRGLRKILWQLSAQQLNVALMALSWTFIWLVTVSRLSSTTRRWKELLMGVGLLPG
jgi:hypothetical protein